MIIGVKGDNSIRIIGVKLVIIIDYKRKYDRIEISRQESKSNKRNNVKSCG